MDWTIGMMVMVINLNKVILELDTEEMMVMNLNGQSYIWAKNMNAVIMKEDPYRTRFVLIYGPGFNGQTY